MISYDTTKDTPLKNITNNDQFLNNNNNTSYNINNIHYNKTENTGSGLAMLVSPSLGQDKQTQMNSVVVIVVTISGLTDFNRSKIEQLLVTIPGVISFLLDTQQKIATVRCNTSKCNGAIIVKQLHINGFNATLSSSSNEKENNGGPEYLSEPSENDSWNWYSIVSFNQDKKKQTSAEQNNNGGWLSSIRGYFF